MHCDIISMLNFWVWRRLVARYLGVVEAAGSNPVTQTILTSRKWLNIAVCGISFLRISDFVRYLSATRYFSASSNFTPRVFSSRTRTHRPSPRKLAPARFGIDASRRSAWWLSCYARARPKRSLHQVPPKSTNLPQSA